MRVSNSAGWALGSVAGVGVAVPFLWASDWVAPQVRQRAIDVLRDDEGEGVVFECTRDGRVLSCDCCGDRFETRQEGGEIIAPGAGGPVWACFECVQELQEIGGTQ